MTEIAGRISSAIGKPVRYVAITPEERRETLLAAGTPAYFADALYEQAIERLRNPHAEVLLKTHETFAVRPTDFAQFAQRNAASFGGLQAAA